MKTFIRTSLGLGLLALILAACNISPTPGERPQIRAMEDPQVEENFGFIPNSGEASVSKVDLVSGEAVARYWTAPRVGDEVDLVGNETPGESNDIDPYDWRTARITMDAEGNAWVINTGADGTNLQGTIARIQGDADPDEINTNNDHASPLPFGTDEAVQVFEVGEPGDIPRTAVFDADGHLWVGFHMQQQKYGYFKQYAYDGENLMVLGTFETDEFDLAPYEARIDKNGIMWFASYGSSHLGRHTGTFAADHGMYSLDTNDAEGSLIKYGGIDFGYGILVDNGDEGDDVKVYATTLESPHSLWMKEGADPGDFVEVAPNISGASGLRGMSFDRDGVIWIASSGNGSVSFYNPENEDSGSYTGFGNTPVGVGMDASGIMWVVQRGNDLIRGFDPEDPEGDKTDIDVGYRPYAYGDFVTLVETGAIEGYKAITEDLAAHQELLGVEEPLAGWEIKLHADLEDDPIQTTNTDKRGYFLFEGLDPGTYNVCENVKEGTEQVDPEDGECHQVQVVAGEITTVTVESKAYAFLNDVIAFDETAWAAHDVGEIRFVDQGNWATYVEHTLNGDDTYPIFAGQHKLVGKLVVSSDGEDLTIEYVIFDEFEDYVLALVWSHLHVAEDEYGVPRAEHGRTGELMGPIPGHFDFTPDSAEFDPEGTGDHVYVISYETLEVETGDEIVIAAHAEVRFTAKVE